MAVILDGSRPSSGDSVSTLVLAIFRDLKDSLENLSREPQTPRKEVPFIPRLATLGLNQLVNRKLKPFPPSSYARCH
jgi:hypothetical protein